MALLLERYRITGARFHFGRHGLGQEETAISMTSDSLFSAIVACLAEQLSAQEFKDFLAPFIESKPPFVLTSTFPCVGNVALFPAFRTPGEKDEATTPTHKKLKNIRYVTEPIFRELLAGKPLGALYAQSQLAQGETVLCQAGDGLVDRKFWAVGEHAHVTIDRVGNNPALFFTGEVSFNTGCGLWFGVHWLRDKPVWRTAFETALEELQVRGLGGERNNGFGECTIEQWGAFELPDAHPDGYWTNLSRYLPRPTEADAILQACSYTIEAVGGWLGSAASNGQRRKTVNMVAEGAVMKRVDEAPVYGQMEHVAPNYAAGGYIHPHPVFRAGFAVPVGVQEVSE